MPLPDGERACGTVTSSSSCRPWRCWWAPPRSRRVHARGAPVAMVESVTDGDTLRVAGGARSGSCRSTRRSSAATATRGRRPASSRASVPPGAAHRLRGGLAPQPRRPARPAAPLRLARRDERQPRARPPRRAHGLLLRRHPWEVRPILAAARARRAPGHLGVLPRRLEPDRARFSAASSPARPAPLVGSGSSRSSCSTRLPDRVHPAAPPDLDCGEIRTALRRPAPDPHGFDGRRDGRGCES